jgi:hypothetical protein
MINITATREKFDKALAHINRPGIDNLVKWLQTTDFFTAPASTNFHGNYDGGLMEHSVHVVELALTNFNYICKYKPDLANLKESVILVGLFHDVCKVNQYHRGQKWIKDDNNKWKSYMGYQFKDDLPLGHGEKSLYMVSKFIDLTPTEALAVRWHMGSSEVGTQIDGLTKYSYSTAWENPLVQLIHIADMASLLLAETIDYKSQAQ